MVERFDFSKMQGDETYIYVDKEGNLQKGLDLTVTWIGDSEKSVLITTNPSDSLDYLKILIGESMSKYPLFEGLTQLVARRLQDEKGFLVKTDRDIGSVLQPGQKLWCDLMAADLWIDVRLQVPHESLKISFEVRINTTATNDILKSFVFKCALDVLHSQNVETGYYLGHIFLYRYSPNVYVGPAEAMMGRTLLPEADSIGDTFDFRSRYVTGVLNYAPKQLDEAPLNDSSNSSLSSDDSVDDPKKPGIRPLASRNIKTEKMGEAPSVPKIKRTQSSHPVNSQCDDCRLV